MTNQNSILEKIKLRLTKKQEIRLIFRSKHFFSSYFLSTILEIKICKATIFEVLLYDCEICCLTLREECRLRIFEKGILRRIFGSKKNEIGEWRMILSEEIRSLYRSPNTGIIRVIKYRGLRWAAHVARIEVGDIKNNRKA